MQIHNYFRNTVLTICFIAVWGMASAQTLPAPPISPPSVTNYEYDAQGNSTKTVQAPGTLNFSTQATYDTLSRVKDSTDAKLGKTQFDYDGLDRTLSITDPRNLVTQTPRNGLGDATALVSPDTGTANLTFDEAGNLKTRTDSRGVKATHTYDALNRRTKVFYSLSSVPSHTYKWLYDQTGAGFANGVGRLTSTNHPTGSTQTTYTPEGRVLTDIQRVKPTAGANLLKIEQKASYGYTAAGDLGFLVYPSGRKLSIGYSGGKPSWMYLAPSTRATPITIIDAINWQPFGAAQSWNWQMASSKQAYERVFDTSGRLVRYRLGNKFRDLTYDSADRISAYTHYNAITGVSQPALDQSFSYDELGRLTQATLSTNSWVFTYDANGNRTSASVSGATRNYAVSDSSNRIDSISSPSRSFIYDNAGNTLTDDQFSATYDLSGRMDTLTRAGITTTYAYDGFGQRIRKFSSTGADSTVVYFYDTEGHLLGEYDSTGAAIREYVWLGDTPVAVFMPNPTSAIKPPLVYYIHTDHLDTPRVVVDKNNNVRWRWMSEPFGVNVPETNPSGLGEFTFNLRFPGQVFDQESGLHDNWFRSYDSSIGRYITSDPIGLSGGINTYSYVGGNPVSDVDPNGLKSKNWVDNAIDAWKLNKARKESENSEKSYDRGFEAGVAAGKKHCLIRQQAMQAVDEGHSPEQERQAVAARDFANLTSSLSNVANTNTPKIPSWADAGAFMAGWGKGFASANCDSCPALDGGSHSLSPYPSTPTGRRGPSPQDCIRLGRDPSCH